MRNFDVALSFWRNNGEKGNRRVWPIVDGKGRSFDSRKAGNEMPKDADANGAYHIAMKGL